MHAVDYVVTVVTYTCGHTADFHGSAPKMKDFVTCVTCFKDVYVSDTTTEARTRRKMPGWGLTDE